MRPRPREKIQNAVKELELEVLKGSYEDVVEDFNKFLIDIGQEYSSQELYESLFIIYIAGVDSVFTRDTKIYEHLRITASI